MTDQKEKKNQSEAAPGFKNYMQACSKMINALAYNVNIILRSVYEKAKRNPRKD